MFCGLSILCSTLILWSLGKHYKSYASLEVEKEVWHLWFQKWDFKVWHLYLVSFPNSETYSSFWFSSTSHTISYFPSKSPYFFLRLIDVSYFFVYADYSNFIFDKEDYTFYHWLKVVSVQLVILLIIRGKVLENELYRGCDGFWNA